MINYHQKAKAFIEGFNTKIHADQLSLVRQTTELLENFKRINSKTDTDIINDLKAFIETKFSQLQSFLDENSDLIKAEGSYSVKTQKLTSDILPNIIDQLKIGITLEEILNIAELQPLPELKKESDEYFGSSQVTFKSASLYCLYHFLKDESTESLDLADSAILFGFKLPEGMEALSSAADNPFITESQLIIPHSGYSFGGARSEETSHAYAPIDCSSLLGKVYGLEFAPSTADLLMAARLQNPCLGLVPTNWLKEISEDIATVESEGAFCKAEDTSLATALTQVLENPTNMSQEVVTRFRLVSKDDAHNGDLIVWRKFKADADKHISVGLRGGHSGILFSKDDDGKLFDDEGNFSIYSANREMPDREGLGFESLNYDSLEADNAQIVILRRADDDVSLAGGDAAAADI